MFWPADKRRRVVVGIVVAAVGAIAVLLLSGSDSKTIPGKDGTPAYASPSQLSDLAHSLGHPIYRLGDRPGAPIEVTHTAPDNTYVRYLSGGAEAGDPHPDFTSVGTYLRGSALEGLKTVAAQPGQRQFKVSGGGLAVAGHGSKSVYLAYPGSDYQIEVSRQVPRRHSAWFAPGRFSRSISPPVDPELRCRLPRPPHQGPP